MVKIGEEKSLEDNPGVVILGMLNGIHVGVSGRFHLPIIIPKAEIEEWLGKTAIEGEKK